MDQRAASVVCHWWTLPKYFSHHIDSSEHVALACLGYMAKHGEGYCLYDATLIVMSTLNTPMHRWDRFGT